MRARPPKALVTAAVAVGVALVAALPLVVADRFLIKVLTFAGIDVIVVTGLALLFGYAGQISLGHAAFVGIGAYASAIVTVRLGWPWLAGMAVAIVASALGGFLLALPSLRLRGHYLAMATLGFGEIMYLAAREAEPYTGGQNGFTGIRPPQVASIVLTDAAANYWLVWGVAGVALLLAFNIVRVRPGRAMRATHGSELGAQASGVDITRVKVQVFTLSAALAGVAGALHAHFVGFISPQLLTLSNSVEYIAKTVIGGTASLAGPALSAVFFRLLHDVDALVPGMPDALVSAIQAWLPDIYGLTIILVMLFAPGGIAGMLRRLRRPRRSPGAMPAGEAGA